MKNIRMVVTDLDRTLLRTDKTISDYTKSVLNKCKAAGIIVVFATARPVRTVKDYLNEIPCDAVIYHNGAAVYCENRKIFAYTIPAKTAKELLFNLSTNFPQMKLSAEIDDTLYANFDTSQFWSNTNSVRTDFTDLPEKDADKIIAGVPDTQTYDAILTILPENLYAEISDGKLVMVMNRLAKKCSAVRAVADYFHIGMENVAAFGDDYNDIEMLKAAGMGVAVSNAIEEVKSAADFITCSNDDDGVALFVQKNLLISEVQDGKAI